MIAPSNRRGQAGFALIELSLAFAVLGVAAVLLWQLLGPGSRTMPQALSRDLLERAQDAVYAFARLHGRLPCAAAAGGGEEDCTITDGEGFFPFLTVGWPESTPIRYRIPPTAPSLTAGTHFQVVWAEGVLSEGGGPAPTTRLLSDLPGASPVPRLLDLCASLAEPASATATAFALAVEGAARASFQRPSPRIVVSRTEAAGALDCTAAVAPARAHFNTLLASAIIRRGATDAVDQFNREYWTNDWNLAQGSYSSYAAAFSFSKASWLFSNAEARYKLNKPDYSQLAYRLYAASSMVGAGIASGTSLSNLGRFGFLVDKSTAYKNDIEKNLEDLTRLDVDMNARAVRSADRSYFLEPSP